VIDGSVPAGQRAAVDGSVVFSTTHCCMHVRARNVKHEPIDRAVRRFIRPVPHPK
jgi:hypothetical protein